MQNKLTWQEFVDNVVQWSAEKGIYEHSDFESQLLKTFSEAGELADAVIKGDVNALKDAIGDVAVCLVNVGYLDDQEIGFNDYRFEDGNTLKEEVKILLRCLCDACVETCLSSLRELCHVANLDFYECITIAWDEIKDRKGRMVEGGAFVKEE